MAFKLPTLDEMTDLLVRDFKNRMPGADVSRTSDNWKRLRNFALGATSLHRHAKQVDDDIMPDTAAGDRLDRWGAIYEVPRLPATPASKANALRVFGDVAAAITIGDTLTDPAGLRYKVNETTTVGGPGFSDVDIIAIDVGAATRLEKETELVFTTTPVGLKTTAQLILDMDSGGDDAESDGKYRTRILDKIAQPEMGGNAQDFRSWARSYEGTFRVDEAYVWPLRGGLGSVHLAALKNGQGSARLLSPTEILSLQDWIDARRPVGYDDFLVIAVTLDPVAVELRIVAIDDPAFVFDWDDSLGYTVTAWTAGTRTLQLNTDRPPSMGIGDRLVYATSVAPLNSCAEYVIEAFGAATTQVILAEKPVQGSSELTTAPPVVGNPVYSGGPLVASIRSKILDFVAGMGPARKDSATGVDYSEGGSYWEGTLRTSKLLTLASSVKGTQDALVVLPAANYTPANIAPNATVGLVTTSRVLVRAF